MSLIPPKRSEALVDGSGRPTSRLAEYLEAIARELPDPVTPTVTGDYTITDESIVFITAPGNITINLPEVTANRQIFFKKQSQTGTTTINPHDMEQIDGDFFKTISTQYESLTLYGDGTTWNVI